MCRKLRTWYNTDFKARSKMQDLHEADCSGLNLCLPFLSHSGPAPQIPTCTSTHVPALCASVVFIIYTCGYSRGTCCGAEKNKKKIDQKTTGHLVWLHKASGPTCVNGIPTTLASCQTQSVPSSIKHGAGMSSTIFRRAQRSVFP